MSNILSIITNHWKETSLVVGLFAGIVALRLNNLRIAKIKKELEVLKKKENPNCIQIASFEQIEKYGKQGRHCPACGGMGRIGGNVCKTCSGIGAIPAEYKSKVSPKSEGAGCYIATTLYEDPCSEEVTYLRTFRDNQLNRSPAGKLFVRFYYGGSGKYFARLLATKLNVLAPVIKLALNQVVSYSKRKNGPNKAN